MADKRITLSAESMSSAALEEALADAMADGEAPRYDRVPAPNQTRSVDPTVLVAIIGASSSGLTALITGFFALANIRAEGKILIQRADGSRIEVPASMAAEERATVLEQAAATEIVHIHLSGDGA